MAAAKKRSESKKTYMFRIIQRFLLEEEKEEKKRIKMSFGISQSHVASYQKH